MSRLPQKVTPERSRSIRLMSADMALRSASCGVATPLDGSAVGSSLIGQPTPYERHLMASSPNESPIRYGLQKHRIERTRTPINLVVMLSGWEGDQFLEILLVPVSLYQDHIPSRTLAPVWLGP